MTNEEINQIIAEWCGFVWYRMHKEFHLPDYCNDLNAMHEAEKKLYPDQWEKYGNWLEKLTIDESQTLWSIIKFKLINATARQRAEALVRTIGKWRE